MSILRKIDSVLVTLASAFLLVPVFIGSFFLISAHFREQGDFLKLAPPTGRYIDFESERLFIQEQGANDGPAIVFVHGAGTWSELWAPTLKSLADEGFHCIAVDMPPFGFSLSPKSKIAFDRKTQAKRIFAVLDALKLKKVTLVGFSFGGRATVTAALMQPERIQRLILVNVSLGFGESKDELPKPPSSFVRFALNLNLARNILTSIATHPALTSFLIEPFVVNPATLTDDVIEMFKKPFTIKSKSEEIGFWLQEVALTEDHALIQDKKSYRGFTAPVHLIWGT